MNKINTLLIVTFALLAITACSSDSKSGNSDSSPLPDTNTTTRFDQLVIDIFDQTSDTGEPVNTNQLSIEINHDESNFSPLF